MHRRVTGLFLCCAACSSKATVAFEVGFQADPPIGPIFLWASVEERLDERIPGPVLAFAGPVEYGRAGAELSIPGIPFGTERVVVVVARARADVSDPLLYYGLSEPFDLDAGTNETVSVLLALVATPPFRPDVDSFRRVVHRRSPWGTESDVSPNQTLIGAPGSVAPWSMVIAVDPALGIERARARADELGRFSLPLGSSDRLEVAVATEDGVGQRSLATVVRDGIWIATLLGKVSTDFEANPHRLGIITGSVPGDPRTPGLEPARSPLSVPGSALRLTSTRGWRDLTPGSDWPPPRHAHAMAYDPMRDRVVLFGGSMLTHAGPGSLGDTWEWDGRRWRDASSQGDPHPRVGHAMVYDGARGRVLMFGGVNDVGDSFPETWEFDGLIWTLRSVRGPGPNPRATPALAFDARRRRVVLFDGTSSTWEWDGEAWTRLSMPGAVPTLRTGHAMTYDPRTGLILLFGGRTPSRRYLQDTWTFDGASWRELQPEGMAPAARGAHVLTYDTQRERVVLAGGTTEGGEFLADSWEWDGRAWHPTAGVLPSPRSGSAAAYDGRLGEVVLFGGMSAGRAVDDELTWNGNDWVRRATQPIPAPSERSWLADDPSRAHVVLYVPAGETWEWSGDRWTRSSTSPPDAALVGSSADPAIAFDRARGTVVMAGRSHESPDELRIWDWDGSSWILREVRPGAPQARDSHALVYDASQERLVLFGGWAGHEWFRTTWELDQTVWRESALSAPQPRLWPSMIYDSRARSLMLFAGLAEDQSYPSGVWSRKGGDWSQTSSSLEPPDRSAQAAAFDSVRGLTVMFGGRAPDGQRLGDTWLLDGDRWSQATLGDAPRPRFGHGLTYDAARREAVLFGGSIGLGVGDNSTWTLPSLTPEARARVVFSVDWRSAGISTDDVIGLDFTARAGGRGSSNETQAAVCGVEALGWDATVGAWQLWGSNSSDVSTPSPITYSTSSSEEAKRVMIERDGKIHVLLRTAPQHASFAPPEIDLEYVELALQYRRPGRDLPRPDSGVSADGGVSPDSGAMKRDATSLDPDAGSPPADAGVSPDAAPADAGVIRDASPPSDTGIGPVDSGAATDASIGEDGSVPDLGLSDAGADAGILPDSGQSCQVCRAGPCECDLTFLCDLHCETCDPECGCCLP
ncbi:MAG: hypothetical protein HY791_06035 [Deltaproteobacteria bacterium]|nr:hypothetical protein [Deltaproteobacteria bacterium]